MRLWLRFIVGLVTLLVGAAILTLPKENELPAPNIARAFAGFLLFCSACSFFPALVSAGGGRIVAAGACVLSLALTGFILLKIWREREWEDLEGVLLVLPIGIATGIYCFTGRLPGWLAGALHIKVKNG